MVATSHYLPFFRYYDSAVEDNTNRDPHTWHELKPVMKKMWHSFAIIILVLTGVYMCHPTITSLVVSEFHDDGDAWSRKYFNQTNFRLCILFKKQGYEKFDLLICMIHITAHIWHYFL